MSCLYSPFLLYTANSLFYGFVDGKKSSERVRTKAFPVNVLSWQL